MKRSTIVAAVAAGAVIAGGAAASAALTSGSTPSAAAQELRAGSAADDRDDQSGQDGTGAGTGKDDRDDDWDDRDDRDDRDDDDRNDKGADGAGEAGGLVEQVITTALAEVPGYVVEVDLDDDDDRRHWDVEIAGDDGREHELKISLDGTKVLDTERERDDDVREKRALLSNASVQAADAVRIAEEHLGGHVKDLDLDKDDRVWEIELRDANGTEWELDVDINSGEVRDVEQDD